MEKAILVDLDGTLTDVDHRVHHVQKEKIDWRAFSEGMSDDSLNLWCAEIIVAMADRGYKIIFVTGRSESYRQRSESWLCRHKISYDELYMRRSKDRREDSVIKEEIYLKSIRDSHDVLFVLDDRLSVVKMWRELGLVCLQCDWGDF